MRQYKSEKLKKLESELRDLEEWMKLGLVPKKDEAKHLDEINGIKKKIDEELERLQFLKESGDWEEYVTPKRNPSRSGYTEMPTIPDLGASEAEGAGSDVTEEYGDETSSGSTSGEDESTSDSETGSFFGRRRRWEGIIDPEGDSW
ncbi:MAG: hypothetical protein KDK78_01120 [Chlamydiia bacterium]|nr:hypothetical protein [Chlamydiia bacterium]